MKDNCNKNCSNCNGTELPNISDTKEINIGYSYAYKTDCAGDRYIKAEEVKYLLKCERNKAIDEFASELENHSIYADIGKGDEVKMEWASPVTRINEIAEQLKAGGENEY